MARLIALAGLPGVGKSTVARLVARALPATWLRIDSIEQALRDASLEVGEAGYRIAYRLAADQLRLGHHVVADSVNPLAVTRAAWRDIAATTGATLLEVELFCSDADEHRRRAEQRQIDIDGLTPPGWEAIVTRDYAGWDRPPLRIDTARLTAGEAAARIVAAA